MREGDILICKVYNDFHGNENIVGNHYIVKKIHINGNKNIYVSTDLKGYKEGLSSCYSSIRNPDISLPYSPMYIHDYFDELVEIRNKKLEDLGI